MGKTCSKHKRQSSAQKHFKMLPPQCGFCRWGCCRQARLNTCNQGGRSKGGPPAPGKAHGAREMEGRMGSGAAPTGPGLRWARLCARGLRCHLRAAPGSGTHYWLQLQDSRGEEKRREEQLFLLLDMKTNPPSTVF